MDRKEITDAVRDTIYRATLCLDDQRWQDWLALCDDDFTYAIKSFSPEVRYDMTYLSGDRKEMSSMVDMLPKHNTDNSPLSRHTVVYAVDVDEGGETASAVSAFTVHQTMLDGINSHVDAGESRIFLVGKYHDKLRIKDGQARFVERTVRLENRRLDKGSHWPI